MSSGSQEKTKEDSEAFQSSASMMIDEAGIETYNYQNSALILENQSLKEQLERALKFTTEMEKVNEKNAALLNQLQESNQKVDGFQQRLRISQQKNADLEEKNRELNDIYQKLNRKYENQQNQFDDTIKNLQQSKESFDELESRLKEISNEKIQFIKSFNNIFSSDLNTLAQITSFIESYKAASDIGQTEALSEKDKQINNFKKSFSESSEQQEKLKTYSLALKKKNSSLSKKLQEKTSQYNETKKELEDLKSKASEQTNRLNLFLKQSETDKDHEQNLQNVINQMQIDRKEEIEKFQQILNSKDVRIHELQERLTNPPQEEDQEYIRIIQELSQTKAENIELSQSVKIQKDLASKFKSKALLAAKKIVQYQKEREAIKSRFNEINQINKNNDLSNHALKEKLGDANEQISSLDQECEHLRAQLKAAEASHQEGKSTFNAQQQDVLSLQTSICNFEHIIQQQETEITALSNERRRFINIIHTQTQMLSLYESLAKSQDKKIVQLLSKINNKINDGQYIDIIQKTLLPELNYTSQEKITSILSNQSSQQPSQKLQILFKEIGKMINNGNTNYSFKTSFISEAVGKKFTKDTLVDYLSALLKTKCNPATIEDPDNFLNKLVDGSISIQQLVDLFLSLIIICINNEDDIVALKEKNNDSFILVNDFQNYFGNKQVSDVTNKIDSLKQKVKRLKKQSHSSNLQYNAELEDKCSKQKEKIRSLEENMRTLLNDATILQSQLEIKAAQLDSIQKNHEKLQVDSSQVHSKHIEELHKYEKSLEIKNQEIKSLTSKISKFSIESEEKAKSLQKSNDDLLQNMNTNEEKYQKIILALKEKLQQLQSSLAEKEQTKRAEIIELVKLQNDLKSKLNESIKVMKEQVEENHTLSQKLQESLIINENNKKAMSEEINRIVLSKRALELQLQSISEQSKREIEIMSSKFTFKTLADETKYKEDINEVKAKLTNEKNSIILAFMEEFDELSNFDCNEIDDLNFIQAIKEIAQNYRSMKYKMFC